MSDYTKPANPELHRSGGIGFGGVLVILGVVFALIIAIAALSGSGTTPVDAEGTPLIAPAEPAPASN